jgi:hypothetical protein
LNNPFGTPYDRVGVDPLDITDPFLHHLIQAGMVRRSPGLTLAQVLKSEMTDARSQRGQDRQRSRALRTLSTRPRKS